MVYKNGIFIHFTSCAAGLLTCLASVVVLIVVLAHLAYIGRRGQIHQLPMLMVFLLRLETHAHHISMNEDTVSPSAALVLY